MVVRADGTKWACQSCLKGHRVSGCTHTDRELTLVPKKGRPVTQCQHCRLERKKRSAHNKCDCADEQKPHHSREKCIHLREADERAKAGLNDDHKLDEDAAHLAAVAEEQGCCCGHGGKCSCSIVKKEAQMQGTTPPHGPAVSHKPRLETTKSDGSITVFANGHHKPVHRKNHTAHECGMPYKMPMSRSHTEHSVSQVARRSVDSLPLSMSAKYNTPPVYNPQPLAPLNTGRRLSKSEQPSPKLHAMSACSGALSDEKMSAIDLSTLGPIQTNQSIDSATSDSVPFSSFDPMSGVADSSFDPWSVFPSSESMPNNNPFSAWPTNFDSSSITQPALTAASSGTQSEIDEIPAMEDLYGFPMPSIQEDAAAATAFETLSADNDGSSINRRSLPPNFFGNADFSLPNLPNEWQSPIGSVHGSDEGKSKQGAGDQALGLPNVWSTPAMPMMSGMARRPSPVTSHPSRPHSHSVGPGSAPNDELIRSLFPDIDINNGTFGSTTGSPTAMETSKRLGGLPNVTSAAIPMDEDIGFTTTQSWSDGSLSVPNDDYPSPFDQTFTGQSYNNESWPFQ
ncbi:hypothetical protein AC578_3574 [Pseudocercospora eumusae]|uniref:Copper-fist domain-containing protein n=1 Tax=Pseudocercospora eumusae TaxID=321146 RepID=A0A139HPI9_9PEZI|nr:hypothetical protein AC578_3574 [Pseudocercospora eumusae]